MESQKNYFVIPDLSDSNVYTCLLSINNEDFIFRVAHDPIYFEAEPKLALLLKGKEQQLQNALERSQNIDSFCERVVHFISKLTNSNSPNQVQLPSSYFRKVLDEIKEIGWNSVTKIDPAFNFIEINLIDPKERKILVRFDLDGNKYPRVPPKVTSNLPIPVRFDWNPNSSTLLDIIELHRNAIQLLQPFWNQMDDLDKNTFIIEPREPMLNCALRRIVITNFLQIQIEVDPMKPLAVPRIVFFGAEQICREMRDRFMSNTNGNAKSTKNAWRPDRSLRNNLEAVLNITFKKGDDKDFTDSDFECGICYTERLGSELPEIICERCSKKFHRSCLLDWLRTRPKAEHSFQVIYGTCPFCESPIQCSVTGPH